MEQVKAPQQVIEAVNNAANILVTVSRDPSVDALSAALGLALVLDKADKHVSAVFSGVVPPAIAFLEPEKIFDDTTDSLRDFIIALNKEKADHLRYKLDGDLVKIFITPYRSTITQNDLTFTQGDFNVDLVIALGVDNQEHLDRALEGHGQILHDATILTVTAGNQRSTLGGIDWHDDNASGLSELAVGIANGLSVEGQSVLDDESATALMTGIVAQTDRFSNEKTSSRVMAIAAQLMNSGANQQLVATQLEETSTITAPIPMAEDTSATSLAIDHNENEGADAPVVSSEPVPAGTPEGGSTQLASAYALDETDMPDSASSDTAPSAPPVPGGATDQAPAPASSGGPGSALTPQSAKRDYIEPLSSSGSTEGSALFGANTLPAPGSVPVNQTPIPSPMLNPAYAPDTEESQAAALDAGLQAVVGPQATPPSPADVGLPMPPPLPDAASPLTPAPAPVPVPPAPQVSTAPLEPPTAPSPYPMDPVTTPTDTTDPGQFKIPGA